MVFIERQVLVGMIADVEPSAEERCGFLFGYSSATSRKITKSMAVRNSNEGNKQTTFEIAAKDYLNAERIAEQENMALLGVYHSHPNHPAIPSEYDRIAAQPFFSYFIISVMNNKFAEIRSWRLNENSQLKEEKMDLI